MKIEYILLIFIAVMFLGFVYLNYRFEKTGKVVGEAPSSVAVTVKAYIVIYDVVVDCQQSSAGAGQSISANITIANKGNYDGDTRIDYWIEDYYGMNYSASSLAVKIAPGYSWSSIKSLAVPSYLTAGIYSFKAKASAEETSQTAYCSFEVTSVQAAPPTARYVPPEKVANVEIQYPIGIIITKNTRKEIEIEVKNSGNVDLHNVGMILQGLPLNWFSISPENITLQQNQKQIFKISLLVPQDAATGAYPIIIVVKSDELERVIHSSVNVVSVLEEAEFQNKKLQIMNETEELFKRLDELEKQGADVSAYRDLVYIIQDKVKDAVAEREKGNLPLSTELLYEALDLLKIAKKLIGGLKPPTVVVWSSIRLIGLMIIGIIIGAVVMVIVLRRTKIRIRTTERLKAAKRTAERQKMIEKGIEEIEKGIEEIEKRKRAVKKE